jgi:hypothetical protein
MMNRELALGTNPLNFATDGKQLVPLPDPRFCSLMLAVMRVLYASGAAEVLDQLCVDDECSGDGSYLGTSTGFDNLLYSKLCLVEMSQSSMIN